MSTTYLAQGIVLRRRDYREYDRLVSIYTDHYGKIEAVARGVRKPASKLAGHLEPFSYSSFMLATGRVFDVLATSVKLSSFRIPQTDLLSFGLASYFFEAVERLTRQRLPDPALFHLQVNYLTLFEESLDVHAGSAVFQRILLTTHFLMQLLHRLGFAPSLDHCVFGHERLAAGSHVFCARHGGVSCRRHIPPAELGRPVSEQTIAILRLMGDGHLEPLRMIAQTQESLREVTKTINELIMVHLGEPLASRAFVRQVLPHVV